MGEHNDPAPMELMVDDEPRALVVGDRERALVDEVPDIAAGRRLVLPRPAE